MIEQIIFILVLALTLAVLSYTVSNFWPFFKITRPAYPINNIWKRIVMTFKVVFLQTKIFRWPLIGFVHALVFWGFLVICIGSIEMVFDGVSGHERTLSFLGVGYDIITAAEDIYAYLVAICILIFMFRRLFFHIRRFEGIEMKRKFYVDANVALLMILFLMVSLILMNISYLKSSKEIIGLYPVTAIFFDPATKVLSVSPDILYKIYWWFHILLVFIFANYLPYSKHFHVFMSIPNVFVSRLEPLGKLPNMENVTREVKIMLNPTLLNEIQDQEPVSRFGVKDAEDITWKNFLDSLSCTQCGRCTSVCPANITGKKLSPRKIFIDLRARIKEKNPGFVKMGRDFNDQRSFIDDYVSREEIWACTLCNACAMECPVNINHPTLIVDLRRYLVMELSAAPSSLNSVFTNIENNGAPWQFSPQDRLLWAE